MSSAQFASGDEVTNRIWHVGIQESSAPRFLPDQFQPHLNLPPYAVHEGLIKKGRKGSGASERCDAPERGSRDLRWAPGSAGPSAAGCRIGSLRPPGAGGTPGGTPALPGQGQRQSRLCGPSNPTLGTWSLLSHAEVRAARGFSADCGPTSGSCSARPRSHQPAVA